MFQKRIVNHVIAVIKLRNLAEGRYRASRRDHCSAGFCPCISPGSPCYTRGPTKAHQGAHYEKEKPCIFAIVSRDKRTSWISAIVCPWRKHCSSRFHSCMSTIMWRNKITPDLQLPYVRKESIAALDFVHVFQLSDFVICVVTKKHCAFQLAMCCNKRNTVHFS